VTQAPPVAGAPRPAYVVKVAEPAGRSSGACLPTFKVPVGSCCSSTATIASGPRPSLPGARPAALGSPNALAVPSRKGIGFAGPAAARRDGQHSPMSFRKWLLLGVTCLFLSCGKSTRDEDPGPAGSSGTMSMGGSAGEAPGGGSPSGGSAASGGSPPLGGAGAGGSDRGGTDPCVADYCQCNPCGSHCFDRNRCICDPCAEGCSGSYCPGRGGGGSGDGQAGEAGESVGGEGGATRADCNPVSPPGTEMICGSLAVWACRGKALSAGVPSFCTAAPRKIELRKSG
jgi:hypothetical protein